MEKENNRELAFLDSLLRRNNEKISVLLNRKSTDTKQYLHYSSHHQRSCNGSVVSSFFNRVYFISAIKEDVIKESARIKQVLKMN